MWNLPKFLHCLSAPPYTRTYSHPHRLHPHAAFTPSTCHGHLSLTNWLPTVNLRNHTHTNKRAQWSFILWPPVHLQPPGGYKPDTHPHSCLPGARSLDGRGLSQWGKWEAPGPGWLRQSGEGTGTRHSGWSTSFPPCRHLEWSHTRLCLYGGAEHGEVESKLATGPSDR